MRDECIDQDLLASVVLGEMQRHGNLTVVPLFTPVNHGPEYLTLKEALENGLLTITEVSQHGTVPELRVDNRAELPCCSWTARNLWARNRTGC